MYEVVFLSHILFEAKISYIMIKYFVEHVNLYLSPAQGI